MRRIVHIICLLSPAWTLAQITDTTHQLPVATVQADMRLEQQVGTNSIAVDLDRNEASIAQVLQMNSPFFIKSYGPGLLATSTLRGSGAAHSPVFWNGINLQSPMNGQLDLNLLPAFFFDDASLIPGGSGNMFGSGAIGGMVMLNSRASQVWKQRAAYQYSIGSFGFEQHALDLGYRHKKKVAVRLRTFTGSNANSFSYTNPLLPGSQEQELQNAASRQQGVLTDATWFINDSNKLDVHYWYQVNDREIPPSFLEQESQAEQWDQSHRLVFNYFHQGRNEITFRNALIFDRLAYRDPLRKLNSSSRSALIIQDLDIRRKVGDKYVFVGLENTVSTGNHPQYGEKVNRNQQAIDLSLKGNWKRWQYELGARQEFVDQEAVPFAMSLGTEYRIQPQWKFRLRGSRVYRVPNFNDLYWSPGGNPDLSPEFGYTSEAGISYQRQRKDLVINTSLTGFYNRIQNWIIWLPNAGTWMAQNLGDVESLGLEWEAKGMYRLSSFRYLRLNYQGSFTQARNLKASSPGDASVGKQLIYVPFLKNALQISFQTKRLELNYRHAFVGGRYTSSDNSSHLNAFDLGSVSADYTFPMKRFRLKAGLRVENLFNERYQVIVLRPMPGRYFQVQLSLAFNQ